MINPIQRAGVVKGSGWNVRGGVGTNYWAIGKVNNGRDFTT